MVRKYRNHSLAVEAPDLMLGLSPAELRRQSRTLAMEYMQSLGSHGVNVHMLLPPPQSRVLVLPGPAGFQNGEPHAGFVLSRWGIAPTAVEEESSSGNIGQHSSSAAKLAEAEAEAEQSVFHETYGHVLASGAPSGARKATAW